MKKQLSVMAVERMFMAKYIGKRLLMMIPVIIGVVFIIYSIMELTREIRL